jgi:hypothetical protein
MKRIVFTVATLLLAVPLTNAAQPSRQGGQNHIKKQTVKAKSKKQRTTKAQAGRINTKALTKGQASRPVVLGSKGPAVRSFVANGVGAGLPTIQLLPGAADIIRKNSAAIQSGSIESQIADAFENGEIFPLPPFPFGDD